MDAKLEATIYLFPAGHGGRENDYCASFARLGIIFPEDEARLQYGCEISTKTGEKLILDRHISCFVQLMNREDAERYLLKSIEFQLFEGARRVGVGVWRA
jgi:hypothetical protein